MTTAFNMPPDATIEDIRAILAQLTLPKPPLFLNVSLFQGELTVTLGSVKRPNRHPIDPLEPLTNLLQALDKPITIIHFAQ